MGSRSSGPYTNMFLGMMKNFFLDLEPGKQKEFWTFVGETDVRLTDPRAPKPAYYLLDRAYEGENQVTEFY